MLCTEAFFMVLEAAVVGDRSSIGVGGMRSFCKNALLPTQLHTTSHLMASIFLISYFQSHILGNLYVLYFCESMPWRGRMDPTPNLFWNYMSLKNLK